MSPFLREFLRSIGREPDNDELQADSSTDEPSSKIPSIDDPSQSTLSVQQHRQYLQSKANRKVRELVAQEQSVYVSALKVLWNDNLRLPGIQLEAIAASLPIRVEESCQVISILNDLTANIWERVQSQHLDGELCDDILVGSTIDLSRQIPAPKAVLADPLPDASFDVVMSWETMVALLEDPVGRGMARVHHENGAVSVHPIHRPLIPRAALQRAVLGHENDPKHTLLTLPSIRGRSVRVLVQGTPRTAHIEFFPNRGEELPNSTDNAIYLLAHMIDPSAQIVRVDATTGKVLEVKAVSVAHALTVNRDLPSQETARGPLERVRDLVHVLSALPTIASGRHVLFYPAWDGSNSVSLHAESQKGGLEVHTHDYHFLDRSARGLEACFRLWRWTEDRVPYTFPAATKKAKK